MAKKLTYVQIIRNIVESEINSCVWDNAEKIADVKGITLESEEDLIHFNADVEVDWHKYDVHGAVNEYGNAWISLVEYHRMQCTEKDEHGEWITESAKPITGLVYGEALKTFKFDK